MTPPLLPSLAGPLIRLLLLSVIISRSTCRHALDSDADLDAELNGKNASQDISSRQCSHLLKRQEWRTLSDEHKSEYIRAVKCTRKLPKLSSYAGVQSRFDDFQAVHIHTADSIHYTGHFLPWHRRFVTLFEQTLRRDCDYRGAIPIRTSPVFDPVTGFGGDGVKGTYTLPDNVTEESQIIRSTFVGCVMDGPFGYNASDPESFVVHGGPGKLVTTHCLVRGINDGFKQFLSADVVQNALRQQTYEEFRLALEGNDQHHRREESMDDSDLELSEHASGHLVVGGELGNLYSSPGEPLFFLHHANLDRIWWNWQIMDPDQRLADMSGNVLSDDVEDAPEDGLEWEDWISGQLPEDHDDQYNGIDFGGLNASSTVTLDLGLRFGPLGETIHIRDIMDITQFPSCYIYI
ncbi:Tyrosinase P [Psilocybe cubensis]|uniref:Tyrosinase P n=1 Tax=Psilocybe cubensis TaxID=181762 RepID=A0ACB8GTC1_PSICU|nr:Tyrosinase P [Psilocybe cubensis]KAH9478235.1 Tyrosinase P [Psilocybe cubensis]